MEVRFFSLYFGLAFLNSFFACFNGCRKSARCWNAATASTLNRNHTTWIQQPSSHTSASWVQRKGWLIDIATSRKGALRISIMCAPLSRGLERAAIARTRQPDWRTLDMGGQTIGTTVDHALSATFTRICICVLQCAKGCWTTGIHLLLLQQWAHLWHTRAQRPPAAGSWSWKQKKNHHPPPSQTNACFRSDIRPLCSERG